MKKQIILIVCIILSFESFSQNLIWEKLVNYLPTLEVINSVTQDSDTTFIFCGTGSGKTYFTRVNLNGDTLWKKNKSVNTCYNPEYIKYIVNGELMHFGNKDVGGNCTKINFLFQKLSQDGTVILSRDYGNNGVQNILMEFTLLPEGGVLGSGSTGSSYNLSLMKLNSSFDSLWYKTFRPLTTGSSVIVNQKGNYILYGSSADQPILSVYHPYFIEVTPEGDSLHSKYVIVRADTANEIMSNHAMIATSDNHYVFLVRLDSVESKAGTILGRKAGVILLDSLFNIKWRTYLNPTGSQRYYTADIIELKDSTYIALVNNSYLEDENFYLYKISKTGQIIYKKTFTSSVCSAVILNEMKLLSDSSLVISGACGSNSSAYIARIGSVGLPQVIDTCASFKASFKAEQEGDSITFINTSNGGYAYASTSAWKFSDSTASTVFNPKFEVTGTVDSVWARLITANPAGCKDTIEKKVKVIHPTGTTDPVTDQNWKVTVYPNPSFDVFNFKNTGNNSTSYTLSIISSIGEEVGNFYFNSKEFSLNTSLAGGMYFYLLTDDKGNRRSGKLMVE